MTGPRQSTRSLTEGALLASLAVILVLAGQFLPLIGPLIIFLWPVPIIVVVIRHGLRAGILTVITAGLVLSMVVGLLHGAILAFTLGASGLVMGWGLRVGRGATHIVLAAGVALVGVAILSLLAARYLLATDVIGLSIEALRQSVDMAVAFYQGLGVPAQDLEQARILMTAALDLVPVLMPAGVVAGAVVNAYINLAVARGVLRRLDYRVPDLPAFAYWRVPTYALIAYALGIAILYLEPEGLWLHIGLNIYHLLSLVFLVQGLAVAYYFLKRLAVPRFLAVVMLVLTATPLGHLFILAGIVEVGFGLRDMVEARDRRRQGGPTRGRREDE